MVDNASLYAPAITSFTWLWIVQVLCNSRGVGQTFIRHVLNWLQCNRERVALDPPSWIKAEQEAPAWPSHSQNWINGTGNLQQSAELVKKPTGMLSHTYTGRHTAWRNLIPFLRNKRGLHKYSGFVTNRCNPRKCRVKHHSHIHLHRWKRETSPSLAHSFYKQWQNPQPLSVVTTCFASSLQQHLSPHAMQHCINNGLSNSATLK